MSRTKKIDSNETELNPEALNLVTPEPEPGEGESVAGGSVEKKQEMPEQKDDGRVEYTIPMNVFGDEEHVTVGLNGKNYQIEVGVPVRVPKGVKEILDESIKRKKIASGKLRNLVSKSMDL